MKTEYRYNLSENGLPEHYSGIKNQVLEFIYTDLRMPESSRVVFTERFDAFLADTVELGESLTRKEKTIEDLVKILRDTNPDKGDLNAAISYIDNLIRHI